MDDYKLPKNEKQLNTSGFTEVSEGVYLIQKSSKTRLTLLVKYLQEVEDWSDIKFAEIWHIKPQSVHKEFPVNRDRRHKK